MNRAQAWAAGRHLVLYGVNSAQAWAAGRHLVLYGCRRLDWRRHILEWGQHGTGRLRLQAIACPPLAIDETNVTADVRDLSLHQQLQARVHVPCGCLRGI